MPTDLSAKYYQDSKGRLQKKKAHERNKSLSKEGNKNKQQYGRERNR